MTLTEWLETIDINLRYRESLLDVRDGLMRELCALKSSKEILITELKEANFMLDAAQSSKVRKNFKDHRHFYSFMRAADGRKIFSIDS